MQPFQPLIVLNRDIKPSTADLPNSSKNDSEAECNFGLGGFKYLFESVWLKNVSFALVGFQM